MRSIILALALLVTMPSAALAQSRRPLKTDDIFAFKNVGDPQVSPEGKWVAYTVPRRTRRTTSPTPTSTWCRSPAAPALRLTASEKSESSPRWSPDGRWLAFLSGRDGKKTQVWLLDRRGRRGGAS